MNLHLTENDLLRDIFELGSKVVPITMAANKQNKLERVSNCEQHFKLEKQYN